MSSLSQIYVKTLSRQKGNGGALVGDTCNECKQNRNTCIEKQAAESNFETTCPERKKNFSFKSGNGQPDMSVVLIPLFLSQ